MFVYRHGGWSFLLSYPLLLFLFGLPLYHMELCLGQIEQVDSPTSPKSPMHKHRHNPLPH